MADNWEDLLNEEVIVLEKKVENGTKGFDDEDKEHKSKVPEKLPVEEEPRDSVPKENKKKIDKKIINDKTPVLVDPFGVPINPKSVPQKPSYEEKKKNELASIENDEKNIADLFGDLKFENKNIDDLLLKDENGHVQFAKVIGKILNRSNVKLHVVEFYKELLTSLYSKFTSKEYQDINAKVTVLFNQKQKEEKPQNVKKKGSAKPTLKATKADQNQIVGDEEEFGEDDEVAVDYAPKYNKDDDFM